MSQPPGDTAQSLQAAIAALESQRAVLGDAVVDVAVAGLRAQLDGLRAPPDAGEQALRLVSILFLDVVGSTSLGQRLDPEEIHAVMDGAMTRFTGVVQAHGGRVLQYAGDSLLAGFGTVEVHEDDAERAVRCGLALLVEAGRVGGEVRAAHGHDGFNVRVGIHSGRVLLGGGVDAEGTIRGSAVNVAARMEQSAAPGSLLISVDTYRLVPGRFEVQQGQLLRVKGIDAPMLSYGVERASCRAARSRCGTASTPSPPPWWAATPTWPACATRWPPRSRGSSRSRWSATPAWARRGCWPSSKPGCPRPSSRSMPAPIRRG